MNEKGISLVQLRQRKTRQTAALFLAPVIILLVVFIAYPIIDTFITSGYQWNGISADKKMVGLANWAKLIKDTKFWIAFKNNVIIMILSIIIQIPLGLAMATFLDFGGKKLTIFKVIWFIPMLMSSVAIGFLFTYALATNGGIVSTISGWFGGGNIDLLGNPKLALITVILIQTSHMMYLKQQELMVLQEDSISGRLHFHFLFRQLRVQLSFQWLDL